MFSLCDRLQSTIEQHFAALEKITSDSSSILNDIKTSDLELMTKHIEIQTRNFKVVDEIGLKNNVNRLVDDF